MKLDGFDELNKKLAQISKNQAIQRNRFVAREAENLLFNTKNYTPVAEVDGGTLRESWKRTRAKEGIVHVYNNTDYALHVEYGHRQKKRWVPGRWENGHFVYDPDEKESGMMLKPRFIKGYKMLSRGLFDIKQTFIQDAEAILGDLFK